VDLITFYSKALAGVLERYLGVEEEHYRRCQCTK